MNKSILHKIVLILILLTSTNSFAHESAQRQKVVCSINYLDVAEKGIYIPGNFGPGKILEILLSPSLKFLLTHFDIPENTGFTGFLVPVVITLDNNVELSGHFPIINQNGVKSMIPKIHLEVTDNEFLKKQVVRDCHIII